MQDPTCTSGCLAVLGGIVKALQRQERTFWSVVSGALTAGFTGIVVYLSIQHMDIPPGLRAGITGISGYAGGDLLPILVRKLCKVAELCGTRK